MMDGMQKRSMAATALLAASVLGLAVSVYRYVWPGEALAPHWLPEAKVEALSVEAFPITPGRCQGARGGPLGPSPRGGRLAAARRPLPPNPFGKNGRRSKKAPRRGHDRDSRNRPPRAPGSPLRGEPLAHVRGPSRE